MGQFVVSPTTHPTACGRFSASLLVQRAQSTGRYCRVFRYDRTFATREAARIFAITQGWLECLAPPSTAQ